MKKNSLILITILLLILFLGSCSRKAPEIYDYYWQINIIDDVETKRTYEKLSLFVSVHDDDGIEDIEKIYLLHDEEELFWEINSQVWNNSDLQGETWIGSNGIRMNDYSDIPEGEYRILLQDISGEYDEKTFLLKRPDVKKSNIIFPRPEMKEEKLFVKGMSSVYSLWIYDRKWNHIPPTYEIKKSGFDLRKILSRKKELEGGFYYYLYIFDSSIKRGLISGPFFFVQK
ncbi:MAG: hypothetical protein JXJ04_25740 [Spirochaetales bacterium]|nr:hypothetical protein [Spirochaetales bacterium]